MAHNNYLGLEMRYTFLSLPKVPFTPVSEHTSTVLGALHKIFWVGGLCNCTPGLGPWRRFLTTGDTYSHVI